MACCDGDFTSLSREELLQALKEKEAEITKLKTEWGSQELELNSNGNKAKSSLEVIKNVNREFTSSSDNIPTSKLSNSDITRYSRQLILPEIGVKGQLKLKNSSMLIVGGGGLGCPASLYLAAAGVGKIGVIDYDEIEVSNLHRQISHTESRVGMSKALSIAHTCKSLNSSVEVVPYQFQINSTNALQVIQKYDIVLDATDNVATRYLLNDACVLSGKPLVSGSALRFEGQMTVYNCDGGPCYRCLFPKPPPPDTVTNCSDGGVLGVVPGIIGSLQALEAIKMAAGLGTSFSNRMLLFDGVDGTFRNIKLRPKSASCVVCGNQPSLTKLIDYEQFCGAKASDKDKNVNLLSDADRILPKDFAALMEVGTPHLLIDVRQPVEIEICSLSPAAINIPITEVKRAPGLVLTRIQQELSRLNGDLEDSHVVPVVCLCRKGNDSQVAVAILKAELQKQEKHKALVPILDLKGGLYGWKRKVDPSLPIY